MCKVFLCFLFLNIGSGLAQEKEQKIAWDESRPLSWGDFLGSPESGDRYDASTNSGISYSWSLATKDGKEDFVYDIRSNFYPNLSWVKNGEGTAQLLAHEQLHFDISELHARKLRREIKNYVISRNIKRDLREIYRDIEDQRREMQSRFDRESGHSTNREAEAKWQEYVKRELEKLQHYAR